MANIILMKIPVPEPQEALAELGELTPSIYEAMEIATQVSAGFFRALATKDRRDGRIHIVLLIEIPDAS